MFITQFRTFFKLFIFLLGIVLPIYGKAWPVSSGKFAVVHAFEATNSPSSFSGPKSLIKARDGNIYGVTGGDILDNSGIIFKLDLWQQPAAYSDYFKFADFDNVTEDLPFIHPRHLFQTRDGSFYVSGLGPGAFAGPEFLYQVSSLSPPKASLISTYPTLMSDATGSHRLVQSKDGKFYTTTTGGGDYIASQPYLRSAGTIVEIDPENKDEFNQAKILHIFDGYNGANPLGGLIRIKDSFYGTACQTAKDNNGTVTAEENGVIFRYDLTGKYTVLHRFKGADGACPEGELLRARNGKLYGVTSAGGKANLGVIFELDIKFPVPLYRVLRKLM